MSTILSPIESPKLYRAGRDTPASANSPKQNSDRDSVFSAAKAIMADLQANDKLCVERCNSTTMNFKAATVKIDAAIAGIIAEPRTPATEYKITVLKRNKAELEKVWEQQVTEYTCANLEAREKFSERVRFVARAARGAGVEVQAAVRKVVERSKDQSWWEEVDRVLDQVSQ